VPNNAEIIADDMKTLKRTVETM